MPVKTQAFRCSHCGMTSLYRTHVTRHENDSCRKNPDRRGCPTCRHASVEHETTAADPANPYDYDISYKVNCCAVGGLTDDFDDLNDATPIRYHCHLWEKAQTVTS